VIKLALILIPAALVGSTSAVRIGFDVFKSGGKTLHQVTAASIKSYSESKNLFAPVQLRLPGSASLFAMPAQHISKDVPSPGALHGPPSENPIIVEGMVVE
jgi:hypothetical protein